MMSAHARTSMPSLADISAMPVGEIVALPADDLFRLRHEARRALDLALRLNQWLDGIARIKGDA